MLFSGGRSPYIFVYFYFSFKKLKQFCLLVLASPTIKKSQYLSFYQRQSNYILSFVALQQLSTLSPKFLAQFKQYVFFVPQSNALTKAVGPCPPILYQKPAIYVKRFLMFENSTEQKSFSGCIFRVLFRLGTEQSTTSFFLSSMWSRVNQLLFFTFSKRLSTFKCS